jgi:hypothetical protein
MRARAATDTSDCVPRQHSVIRLELFEGIFRTGFDAMWFFALPADESVCGQLDYRIYTSVFRVKEVTAFDNTFGTLVQRTLVQIYEQPDVVALFGLKRDISVKLIDAGFLPWAHTTPRYQGIPLLLRT